MRRTSACASLTCMAPPSHRGSKGSGACARRSPALPDAAFEAERRSRPDEEACAHAAGTHALERARHAVELDHLRRADDGGIRGDQLVDGAGGSGELVGTETGHGEPAYRQVPGVEGTDR